MVQGEEVRRLRGLGDLIATLLDPARLKPYAERKLGRCKGCGKAKAEGEVSILGLVSWPLCRRCMRFAEKMAILLQRMSP